MRMSDLLAEYIKNVLDESDGIAEIQRNELANNFGCVPSQINYVISSRFTQEKGYVVESKRGGGGYIKITKIHINADRGSVIMHIVNSIGNSIDATSANIIIENLMSTNIISENIAKIFVSAISEQALADVQKPIRNVVRSKIMKNVLLALI